MDQTTHDMLLRLHKRTMAMTGEAITLRLLLHSLIAHHPDGEAVKATFQMLATTHASELSEVGFERHLSANSLRQILQSMEQATTKVLQEWPKRQQ